MAPATMYVNKPGGIIATLKDGTADSFQYGDRVSQDMFADHIDISTFSDGRQRVAVESQELEAHRRAALTENGQINSSSSPVPGNYSELDEDGAAQLMSNLARFPEMQVAILKHEVLFGGNRQKVLDAAGDSAKVGLSMQLGALPDSAKEMGDVSGPSIASLGDPDQGGINRDDASAAARIQEQHAAQLTPPPSSDQDDDSTTKTSGRSNDGSSNDGAGAEATSFSDFSHGDLQEYIGQHDLPVPKNQSTGKLIKGIQSVEGHEAPQTPPASKS